MKKKQRIFLLFMVIMTLCLAQVCRAGSGTFVSGNPHYLNLNLYYTYTPDSLGPHLSGRSAPASKSVEFGFVPPKQRKDNKSEG